MWNMSRHIVVFPLMILEEETGGIPEVADVSRSILTNVSSAFLSHEVSFVSFCLADFGLN